MIGAERLCYLAKIILHGKTGVEIYNCGPLKEINLQCLGICGCGDRW